MYRVVPSVLRPACNPVQGPVAQVSRLINFIPIKQAKLWNNEDEIRIQNNEKGGYDIQVNDRGQITIPKQLRDKVNIHPNDNLKIDMDEHGRLVLFKKDLLDDLEYLIKRDLINEGFTEEYFAEKIPERKKELVKALMEMVKDLKKEFKDEGQRFSRLVKTDFF